MDDDPLQFLTAQADGKSPYKIAYRYRKPAAEGLPTFLWLCGFMSDMDSTKATALAKWTKQHGFGCLRFDHSGRGHSQGRFEEGTISKWLSEARSIAELSSKGPLVLVGSSMGGWIALLLAQSFVLSNRIQAPKAIVLLAPAWDMTQLMWDNINDDSREILLKEGVFLQPSQYGEPYPITRSLIEDGSNHLFRQGPVHIDTPVRVLHGQMDPDVPWRRSLTLLEILETTDVRLTLIKDGEHRLSRPQDLALLFATLSEFV